MLRSKLIKVIAVLGTALFLTLILSDNISDKERSMQLLETPAILPKHPLQSFSATLPQPANTANKSQSILLWAAPKQPPDTDIPGAQSKVEGARLIQFNSATLRRLKKNDVLIIDVPQTGTRYHIAVNKIDNHANGIRVISARMKDNATLLLTLGQQNTFANLATRNGNYELVGNTEFGWLLPSGSMDQHVDHTKPDFVLSKRFGLRN
ncbi:MAG: hypothetical protein KUG75_03065 [Pseudomonadales bacterium]|nr:hypothetical protein [Pseudomonadales bacterium]